MKIAMSGATGFVGMNLTQSLSAQGHHVMPLGRDFFTAQGWEKLLQVMNQADVVINLAGAPINARWTKEYKEELRSSRIRVTRTLVDAIRAASHKPQLFLSTSAVGYYASEGVHNELDHQQGTDFLSSLCADWEAEAQKISSEVRLVITRFGIILSTRGGALPRMTLPMKMKLCPIPGDGTQYFPWISLHDLLRAFTHLINGAGSRGVYNLVAPEKTSLESFLRHCGAKHSCWFYFHIPKLLLTFLLGEGAEPLVKGQCVFPKRLLDEGFEFEENTTVQYLQMMDK